jgi:NAD(P)-dependent dehydrogenase (short-subunit alcohol dehydrogenase family)
VEVEGRVALVTGGVRGIGRAIAEALTARGAHVIVADVDGGDILVDLTREGDVSRMIDEAAHVYGRIDVLVNNAGGYEHPVFPEAPPGHWRRTLELNLVAPMLAIQYVVPIMQAAGRGAIVNIASTAGVGDKPHPGPDYAAAKAGLIRLTAALGWLKERHNIRVNCVCPHTTATTAVLQQLQYRTLAEMAPPPATLLQPAEVAHAVIQLIEDDEAFGRAVVLWGEAP